MKIESIDPVTLAVHVSCGSGRGWELPVKLSSLIMVALDCRIPSIRCELPGRIEPSLRAAAEQLATRNPIVRLMLPKERAASASDLGYRMLGRDADFICVRDGRRENRYSLFVAGVEANVDRASRCAYIIAAVLGFSSGFSFEIRFSVYELLGNIVEHNLGPGSRDWVQIDLERDDDRILIAIVDRGAAFDVTGDERFDLEEYISAKKRRGLGLVMTRRIAEQIAYERESGFNKIIFKKSISSRDAALRTGKEGTMAQFEVSGPVPLGDGSHMLLLRGDLDTKGALVMEQVLSQLMEKKIFQAVFDFEKVPFISSAGVGILLGIVSSLREAGGEATFIKISPKVRSVFRLLNLEDYFTIRDAAASAV